MKHSGVYVILSVSVVCWSIGYLKKKIKKRVNTLNRLAAFSEKQNPDLFTEVAQQQHKRNPSYAQNSDLFAENVKVAQEDVKVAQQQHTRNPSDVQNLKKWASALTKLAISEEKEVELRLEDAKLKLEAALKIDPDDLEAKFELGNVIYYLLTHPALGFLDCEDHDKLCHTAVNHLEEVRNKEPGLYKDSKLEYIKSLLPLDDAELEDMDDDEMEYVEMDVELWTILYMKHKWKSAKIKSTRNSGKNEQKSNDIIAELCKAILFNRRDSKGEEH